MSHSRMAASLLAILLVHSAAYPQASAPAPPKDARLDRATPEGTLRLSRLGVMLANEQLLKATIVPVPAEDLALLTQPPMGLTMTPKKSRKPAPR